MEVEGKMKKVPAHLHTPKNVFSSKTTVAKKVQGVSIYTLGVAGVNSIITDTETQEMKEDGPKTIQMRHM